MSEQANIALIQKIYAAFSTGDIQTILNNVAADAEWINHAPASVPYGGNFTNRIPAFFQAMGDSITEGKVAADKFIAQGDSVVALSRYTAKVRGTGAKIDSPIAHIFTVQNGKVTGWIGFADSAALAAAHTGTAASASR